jgi:hypothetical protein
MHHAAGSRELRAGPYLDMVGKIHTPKAGSKELDVPLVQMNALLGYVADALHATIFDLGLDRETEMRTLRAFEPQLHVAVLPGGILAVAQSVGQPAPIVAAIKDIPAAVSSSISSADGEINRALENGMSDLGSNIVQGDPEK